MRRLLFTTALCSVASAAFAQQAQVLVPSGPFFPGSVTDSSLAIGTGTGAQNTYDTSLGVGALPGDTSSVGWNTAFGWQALGTAQVNGGTGFTDGTDGTAVGFRALAQNAGHANTAVGGNAGQTIYQSTDSIAIGASALNNVDASGLTSATGNTGVGVHSLGHVTTGGFNTAIGMYSMVGCTYYVGFPSGACLLTGVNNTALGSFSLNSIQGAAGGNLALGYSALGGLTTASNNIAIGYNAGINITTGNGNVIIGYTTNAPSPTGTWQLSIKNTILGNLFAGHIYYGTGHGGAVPTLTSCGTTPSLDSGATDSSGTITAGSGALASCTLNFGSNYAVFLHCRVTTQTAVASLAYVPTKGAGSTLVVTGTSLTSVKIDYDCDGN